MSKSRLFIKYETKQFIEGSNAYANEQPLGANPYSPEKQPVFYGRWLNGYRDCQKIVESYDYYHGSFEDEI